MRCAKKIIRSNARIKRKGGFVMLMKHQILAVGTMAKIKFEKEQQKTFVVIIGHLTLSKKMKCHFDYVCVEYPYGIENDIMYINHEDIIEVLYCPDDYENRNQKWIERKYGEHLAYYKHYHYELRPDKEEIRERITISDNLIKKHNNKGTIITIGIIMLLTLGIGITALFTKQWLVLPGAILFTVLGFTYAKFFR